jgi:hypothetical protein
VRVRPFGQIGADGRGDHARFGAWLEGEGLQAIATRVSTGEECSIIITDGYVENTRADDDQEQPAAIKFKAGEF